LCGDFSIDALGFEMSPQLEKKKTHSTAKTTKRSEFRCLANTNINDCNCESLQTSFSTDISEYQSMFNDAYDNYWKGIEGSIMNAPNTFLTSVMKLDNKTATTNEENCELFAEFIHPMTN
jgi:hypothetical protein